MATMLFPIVGIQRGAEIGLLEHVLHEQEVLQVEHVEWNPLMQGFQIETDQARLGDFVHDVHQTENDSPQEQVRAAFGLLK
jgi:hypothetical protein